MADAADDPKAGRIRDGLSMLFAIGGFVVVIVLGIVVIWKDATRAEIVLGTVLPLVATWVGTVIAYYFSKENLAAATTSMNTLNKGMIDLQRLQTIPVKSAMIARAEIITLPTAMTDPWTTLEKTLLTDILAFLDAHKKAVRLPILRPDNTIGYVIHLSVIHQFITKLTRANPPVALVGVTFKDLISDPEVASMARSFATVAADSALDRAKAAMDGIPHCEDIFVTEDGTTAKPVLGWISDDAIFAAARV